MHCRLAIIGLAALTASPALAQERDPEAVISRGISLEVKLDRTAEFESAMKQQIEWYRQNDETWHWHCWQWETGPKTGDFVFRSPGHIR